MAVPAGSYRDLYLRLNRNFASRAALFSLREKELHLDHALLTFIVNFATVTHFAEGAAAYIGMKIVDHATSEAITGAETRLKRFIARLAARLGSERLQPSSDPVESDMLVEEADQALRPAFTVLGSANPPVLEAAFLAGREAASAYLRNNLGLLQDDAAFLAQAVENELRAAFAASKRSAAR